MSRLKKRITELEEQITPPAFRPRVIELCSVSRDEHGQKWQQVEARLFVGGGSEEVTDGEKVPIDD